MNNSINFNRKKARNIIFIVFTILLLLTYRNLILDKIKIGDTEYGEKLLENISQNMTIKKDKNYTSITLPPYITKIPSYEIPPNTIYMRVFVLLAPLTIFTVLFWCPYYDFVEEKKGLKIGVATLAIYIFICICALPMQKKETDLIKEVAKEYSSIENKDKEEFINIIEGKKIFEESTELVEITISSNISNEKNGIEYVVNLVIPERVAIPNSEIRWKTSLIPAEDYFSYIKAYAENSGGKYTEQENLKTIYMYSEHEFTTEKDAQEYIDSLGFSADKYVEIIKKDYNVKDVAIKVPKTAVATTETKLNELLLKYILEKEEYNNIKYVNTPLISFLRP